MKRGTGLDYIIFLYHVHEQFSLLTDSHILSAVLCFNTQLMHIISD